MKAIYLSVDGKQQGPYTQDQLRQAIKQGQFARETPAWHDGLPEWVPVGDLVLVPPAPAHSPPPPPVVAPSHQGRVADQAHQHAKARPVAMIIGGIVLVGSLAGAAVWGIRLAETPVTSSGSPLVAPSVTPVVRATPAVEYASQSPADPFLKQGLDALQTWNFDKAIAVFSQAIEVDSKSVKAFVGRAEAYQANFDYDRAIADETSALRLDPNDADALEERGWDYYQKGDLDNAITDCTAAIALNPDDVAVFLGVTASGNAFEARGLAYYAKGELPEALADLKKYLSLQSNTGDRTGYECLEVSLFIWLIEVEQNHRMDGPNQELAAALQQCSSAEPDSMAPKASHYLLGDLTEIELLIAAKTSPCEADFYIGMKHLLSGDTAGAKGFLQKSVGTRDNTQIQYPCAVARLARLTNQTQIPGGGTPISLPPSVPK
jgi:lipoprotein NlpI